MNVPRATILGLALALAGTWSAPRANDAAPLPKQQVERCVSTSTFASGRSTITLAFDPSAFTLGALPLCAWAVRSAAAVSDYFGRFPVDHVRVVLDAADGGGVRGGSTYGDGDGGRPLTTVRLGRAVTQAELDHDWVMTHEMVHLAVPSVPRNSHWLEEGIATYVEPIARAQRGDLDASTVWTDMVRGMQKGLPGPGDRGLDHTPTWGRTYWGGALFCLLADVAIRERSDNRLGLRDALRGVVAAGGSIEQDSTVASFIERADAAIGMPVLRETFNAMADKPGPDNLDALWRRLGVGERDGAIDFDDDAPSARVRRAITARAASP